MFLFSLNFIWVFLLQDIINQQLMIWLIFSWNRQADCIGKFTVLLKFEKKGTIQSSQVGFLLLLDEFFLHELVTVEEVIGNGEFFVYFLPQEDWEILLLLFEKIDSRWSVCQAGLHEGSVLVHFLFYGRSFYVLSLLFQFFLFDLL